MNLLNTVMVNVCCALIKHIGNRVSQKKAIGGASVDMLFQHTLCSCLLLWSMVFALVFDFQERKNEFLRKMVL